MNSVAQFLITLAGIFIVGAVGEIVFRRTKIPDVLWLILVGVVLGPITGIVTRSDLGSIAPYFAALTLIVILFEGGSRLKLTELTRSAPRAAALAVVTFFLAAIAVMIISMGASAVGWLPQSWSWTHGLLLGAILGGSSSIIIMPAMAQAKVDPKVANLVNLESAFTDAFCVVVASAMVDLMTSADPASSSPAASLLRSFGLALMIGLVSGGFWLLVLRFLRDSDHAYPVTLSALFVLYVAIDRSGGSAALGILSFAIIVGNASLIAPRVGLPIDLELTSDVRGVHRQIAFIIKSFFFTFIGAMLGPPWSLIILGVILAGVLLAARVPGVVLATFGQGFDRADRRLVAIAMPRGMAAGVLATMPAAAGVAGTSGLPTLVFACVVATVLIFAVGFPLAKRSVRQPRATEAASSNPPDLRGTASQAEIQPAIPDDQRVA